MNNSEVYSTWLDVVDIFIIKRLFYIIIIEMSWIVIEIKIEIIKINLNFSYSYLIKRDVHFNYKVFLSFIGKFIFSNTFKQNYEENSIYLNIICNHVQF